MKKSPIIIYVGSRSRGETLRDRVEARGWHILFAEQMMEALAMYAFYFPDIYILEDQPGTTLAREVAFHLRSVHAEPLLVLTDEPYREEWGVGPGTATRALPVDLDPDRLLAEVTELLSLRPIRLAS